MSQFVSPRPRVSSVKGRFVLMASRFNAKYVQGLVTHCTDELRIISPASDVTLLRVPGAFEIPIVVREIARKGNTEAIVALGVILQEETPHAQHLAQVVTQALQQVSLDRGTAAGRTAFEMANLLAELRK